MSQNDKESISALLDNEADDLELRRFLKACEQDPSLLETWERFSLVQSALHDSAHPVKASLSEGIAAKLELEETLVAQSAVDSSFSWKQGVSKMAIAASVAAVFLLAVQTNLGTPSTAPAAPSLAEESSIQSVAENTDAPALLAVSDDSVSPAVDGGIVRQYIESLTLDDEEPVIIEHIQDSPLYRLVNELQAKP